MSTKQDWSKVPPEVKQRKVLNKKSKRDIIREKRISALGGDPIEVIYGQPLPDKIREERMEYWLDLMYPNRFTPKSRKSRKTKKTSNPSLEKYFKETFRFRKQRAVKKGIEFTIKISDVDLVEKCPVFGVDLTFGETLSDTTLTLDRLDPSKGYVPGNVVVISHKANRIKNDASVEEIEKVLNWLKTQKT